MTKDQAEVAIEALIFRASEFQSRIEVRRISPRMKNWLAADIAKCKDAWEGIAKSLRIEIEPHRLTHTKSFDELRTNGE